MPDRNNDDYRHVLRLIENYQSQHGSERFLPPSGDLGEFQSEFLDEYLKKYDIKGKEKDNIKRELINRISKCDGLAMSRFDEPILLSLLSEMMISAREILENRHVVLDQKVLFTTLPSGRVNALAVRFGALPYRVIFIETGLFGFANLMGKILAQCLKPIGDKSGKFSIHPRDTLKRVRTEEIQLRFIDLITSYLCGGDPHLAEPYIPDPSYSMLSTMLTEAFEFFVVGHEYGHIVLGHLDSPDQLRALNVSTPEKYTNEELPEEIILKWSKELEADVFGAGLLLEYMYNKGYDLPMSYLGAVFSFCSVDALHTCAAYLNGLEPSLNISKSHPPSILRRKMLSKWLKSSVEGVDGTAIESALQLGARVEKIFEGLISAAQPRLEDLRRKGLRTQPQWM